MAAVNPRAADALADPAEYPNLFPGLSEAVTLEAAGKQAQVGVEWAVGWWLMLLVLLAVTSNG